MQSNIFNRTLLTKATKKPQIVKILLIKTITFMINAKERILLAIYVTSIYKQAATFSKILKQYEEF